MILQTTVFDYGAHAAR